MVSFDFTIPVGDKNKGTVYLPDAQTKNRPVIIYCHGWGGSRKLWQPTQELCDRAMKANIAFVTFDFFGCRETGGEYSEMTYARWKRNLSDVLDWCSAQSFANAAQVGCYAFSSGSTAALRLAAEDRRVAFVVSVGTCISAHIGMSGGGPAKIFADHCRTLLSGEKKSIFGVDFGAEFYIDTIGNAPVHSVDRIQCPVLFLQGLQDNPYRCADARLAADIMRRKNLDATIIEYENGTHELENVMNEALNDLFAWLPTRVTEIREK